MNQVKDQLQNAGMGRWFRMQSLKNWDTLLSSSKVVAAALVLLLTTTFLLYLTICHALFGSWVRATMIGSTAVFHFLALIFVLLEQGRLARHCCLVACGMLMGTPLVASASSPTYLTVWFVLTIFLNWLCWKLSTRLSTESTSNGQTFGPSRQHARWIISWLVSTPVLVLVAILLVDTFVGITLDMLATAMLPCGVFACLCLCLWVAYGLAVLVQRSGLDSRGYARATVLLGAIAVTMVFLAADPVDDREGYTWTDLPEPELDGEASFATMRRLAGPTAVRPDFPPAYHWTDDPLAYAALIERAWLEASEAREVVDILDDYEAIADLRTDLQIPLLSWKVWHDLSRTYIAYASLLRERGELVAAAKVLSKIESVARKTLPYSRDLGEKVTMIGVHNDVTSAAYELVVDPRCTEDVVIQMSVFLQPLSGEMASLRVPTIGECLAAEKQLVAVDWGSSHPEGSLGKLLAPIARSIVKPETKKRNIRDYLDVAIIAVTQVPPDPAIVDNYWSAYLDQPDFLAFAAWAESFLAVVDSLSRPVATCNKAQVLSELLALEIDRLRGGNLSYPDFFGGPPYLRQLDHWACAGPDQLFGTGDDIILGCEEG